jgi:LuxR family maltose regulon positive regulatory protein
MAVQVLDQLKAHCSENGHARAMDLVRAFEGEFALRRGDIRKANQICRNVDFDVNQPRYFFYVPQFTVIKYLMAEGTKEGLKEAQTRLSALDERMRQINRINVRIEVSSLLAMLCNKKGDDTAAMEHLETALTLAEPGGWIRSFVDLGAPMATLMRHFSERRLDQSFARQVCKACQAPLPEDQRANPAVKKKHAVHGVTSPNPLTRRETEILFLLDEGLSNKKMAEQLFISPGTVKTHLKNIFKKLRAASRIDALKKARESGIIHRY